MNITRAKMKEQYEKRKEDMENKYYGNKIAHRKKPPIFRNASKMSISDVIISTVIDARSV